MRLAQTATWLAIGRSINAASSLILPIVLVRILTQDDFGFFKQVTLAATLLVPFLPLGLDRSVTYFVPRKGSRPAEEISTAILAALVPSALVTAAALLFPSTFATLFGCSGALYIVGATVASAVSTVFFELANRSLIAVGAARTAALLPAAVGVPRAIGLVAVALVARSLSAICLAIIGFALLYVVVGMFALVRRGYLRPALDLKVLARQLRYGGMLAVITVVQIWSVRIDRFLVSVGLSPALFAIYSVGKTQIPFVRIIPGSLGSATAPRYSKLESEGRHQDMAVLWRKSAEALLPLYFLIVTFLAATAHWTVPIVFTADYADAIPIFRVFVVTYIFHALVGIEPILRALAALRFLFITVMISLPVRIGLGLAALEMGSLWFLAGTQIIVNTVLFAIRLLYIRRRLDVTWSTLVPHHGLILPALASAVGLLMTWGIHAWRGEEPITALIVSGVGWCVLTVVVLWRQGLWRQILSRKRESRSA